MAYGIVPSPNGRLMQNLIFAANYLHSHVLHFYQLAALDFVDVKAILRYSGKDRVLGKLKAWVEEAISRKEVFPAAPFLPRYEAGYAKDLDANLTLLSHYAEALEIRRICDEMGAVFGARLPHSTALIPGGCTQAPSLERVLAYTARLKKVMAIRPGRLSAGPAARGQGVPRLLRHWTGLRKLPLLWRFPHGRRGQQVHQARRTDRRKMGTARPEPHPGGRRLVLASPRLQGCTRPSGETQPAAGKSGAYSWIKAPRYRGCVMEVGPLARVLVNYHDPGGSWVKKEVDNLLSAQKIPVEKMASVLGRHVARGLETLWVAKQALKWLDEIDPDGPPARDFSIPRVASGYGLTEAPRGALGHWLSIEDYKIKRYQCVVPTTWNCSPRDDRGQPGAVEQAIMGAVVENPSQPIEVGRIVRSFDPCIACAVH